MAKHGWIITKVNTEFLESDELDTMGPRDINVSKDELTKDGKEFQMRDDDGIVYYEGFVIGDEFAPLDDFGRPNAGCVEILIKQSGKWVTL